MSEPNDNLTIRCQHCWRVVSMEETDDRGWCHRCCDVERADDEAPLPEDYDDRDCMCQVCEGEIAGERETDEDREALSVLAAFDDDDFDTNRCSPVCGWCGRCS